MHRNKILKKDKFYEKTKIVLWSFTALVIGALGFSMLVIFKNEPPKQKIVKEATLVSTVEVYPESINAIVKGFGNVEPTKELIVQPQVPGHIIEINEKLQKGGLIDEGELLFKIDPRDYEIQVKVQEADVSQAWVALEIEKGNQTVAKREWELLGTEELKKKGNEALALRKPQIEENKRCLKLQEADLKKLNSTSLEVKSEHLSLLL